MLCMPWSKTRQILEQDLLCESLKGRVRYFVTHYRHAHDEVGRVCILIDGAERLTMPFSNENKIFQAVHNRPDDSKSLRERYDEVTKEFHQSGIFEPWDFGVAVNEYLANDIKQSLYSENLLVRLLAVFDRRIGKRTLEKLKSEMNLLPEWLQYFYNLRLESENIL